MIQVTTKISFIANHEQKITHNILTLEDAVELVSAKLQDIKNIKNFSLVNELCYRNVLGIKTKKDLRYPLLIKSLLKILFDMDVEIKQMFIIKDKKDHT